MGEGPCPCYLIESGVLPFAGQTPSTHKVPSKPSGWVASGGRQLEADLDNRTDTGQRFSMTFLDGGSRLATDLREGALSYKDVAVFVAVTLKLDYRTGMAAIKADDLAEFIGMNPSMCRACLGRLQQRMLLARGTTKDGGIRYIPNPYVTCCGKVSRRPFLWKLFCQAIETGSVALSDLTS